MKLKIGYNQGDYNVIMDNSIIFYLKKSIIPFHFKWKLYDSKFSNKIAEFKYNYFASHKEYLIKSRNSEHNVFEMEDSTYCVTNLKGDNKSYTVKSKKSLREVFCDSSLLARWEVIKINQLHASDQIELNILEKESNFIFLIGLSIIIDRNKIRKPLGTFDDD